MALRPVPWMMVLELGRVAYDHWREMPRVDRRRLGELLRRSKGLPGQLSTAERRELREIVRRIDVKRMGRDLLPFAGRARRRRRRS